MRMEFVDAGVRVNEINPIYLIGLAAAFNASSHGGYQIAYICAIVGGIANSFLDTGIYPGVSEIFSKAPGVATMGIKFFISISQMLIPFILGITVCLLSADPLDCVFRIQLPLLRRMLISTFGFCFAAASAEASLPLMLSVPHFETLALFTYRLAGAYRFNEVCAAGSILGLLASGFFILGDRLK